jgi:hypothetical protein
MALALASIHFSAPGVNGREKANAVRFSNSKANTGNPLLVLAKSATAILN